MTFLAHLPQRGVISLTGADRVGFLNGLVSNDVALAAPGRAVWAALLTPQGRYLCDFFIYASADSLLLETPREALAGLLTRLKRFKLRAAAELADVSEHFHIYAGWGGGAPAAQVIAPDPRLPEAGFRALSETPLATNATAADYAAHRIALGLPDGPPDLEVEKTLLLEAGFDELHGIAWDKGCYMGQELTARTKYRGLVKRRLIPVLCGAQPPPPGTPILADGVEAGTLGSHAGQMALAMLRVDALGKTLLAGSTPLHPKPPDWLRLPE
ncbi:glycine cleavage system protein T [Acidocella aquatica]|uniref:Glycine cleavage system protein T n=1 Tax=Acidocella aquatica TaxID=1922313 RepID=A0ABQ6A4F5_9PROT|nr:folate-binding protein [Acidocella aquatica]GLR67326.1 glycine cleavage system protein T [Acidocella aquatica]